MANPKKYGIVFYNTLAAAKNDIDNIRSKARGLDQLNIVIRAEADMNDPDLNLIGKVFAGLAWATIHERRIAEGWYLDPH